MAPKRLSASGKSSAHRDTSRAQQGSATGQPTMRSAFVQSLLFAKPSAPGARTLLNTVSKEEHQQKMDEETVALKRRAEEAKEAANKQKRRLSAERSAVGQPGLVASAARHGGSMLDALAAAAAQARGEEDEDATEADSDSSSDAGGASGSASQTYKHSVTGHNVIKPPLGCVVSKSGKSRLWTEHERALVHAKGELRGAPTASTRGCVDNRRRRRRRRKFGRFWALRALLEPRF